MNKKISILLVAILMCTIVSGCMGAVVNENKLITGYAENLAEALENGDGEKIKSLFIPVVSEQIETLDEDIEKLLDLYKGPFEKISKVQSTGGGDSIKAGKRTAFTNGSFTIFAGGERYYCYINICYQNDSEPENVGVKYLRVLSREAMAKSEYEYNEMGLDVSEANNGEIKTIRINSKEYEYNHIDREISESELVSFVENNPHYDAVIKHFGEFTAVKMGYRYYELSDKKHFAEVSSNSEGKITSIHIYDSEGYVKKLWENTEDAE